MIKQDKEKSNWVLGILGLVFLISFLIIFIAYFKYVSIGEWIAKENYLDDGEWFKQIGLFMATMMGFNVFVCTALDFCKYLPFLNKKAKSRIG